MKPIRKHLTDEGFVQPPIDLSKRNEKSEPYDMAKPWKTMLKAMSEVLVLLGPPPSPSDVAASAWYNRIASAVQVYQGEALNEIALVERRRAAPNVSVERAKTIILAHWPDWDRILSALLEAQENAATAAALIRLPSSSSDTPPPPGAGRGGSAR